MTSQQRLSVTAIDAVLAKSIFAALPPTLRDTLTHDAIPIDLPAGSTLYYEADEPRCGLVLAGLLRMYMTAPDGRQMTVRYARTGELVGIAAIVGGPAPVNAQTLTDTALLMLNVRTLQLRGQSEPMVGWLLAQEVTRRLYDVLEMLAGNAFGSLRQRVARHLLDLAASRQHGRSLMAKVTQQELADAVGSVRPVVARIIRELRAEALNQHLVGWDHRSQTGRAARHELVARGVTNVTAQRTSVTSTRHTSSCAEWRHGLHW